MADDEHLSNPAGRLWLLYANAQSLPQMTFGQTMRVYLGLPDSGPTWDYMPVALNIYKQTLDMEAAVYGLVDPALPVDTLLAPIHPIQRLLNEDALGSQRNDWVLAQLGGGETLVQLKHASFILNRTAPQARVDEDTLVRIKTLADEIVDLAMNDEGLDPAARELFVRHAQRISEAAALYKVTGPQPFLDELDRYSSAVHRMKPEAAPTLKKRLNQLFGTVTMAIALFTGPVDVMHAIDEYPEIFTLQQVIEAPAAPGDDASIIVAELEPDESADSATA